MRVTKSMLKHIANNFINTIEKQGLDSLKSLEANLENEMHISESEYIMIELRPSNLGTTTFTISYIAPGTGIPLEVKINDILHYSKIVLKSTYKVNGYEPFSIDKIRNVVQAKTLPSIDIKDIKRELKYLAEM